MPILKMYVASGWFNPEQIKSYEMIHEILDRMSNKIIPYYPKENMEIKPGELITSKMRKEIYESNIDNIINSDYVICNTEGKDMGTIFEAGFAAAHNVPIIYCAFLLGERPFNVMLAESGVFVARTPDELFEYLTKITHDETPNTVFTGKVE